MSRRSDARCKRFQQLARFTRPGRRSDVRGVTLIETLVGLAILGLTVGGILTATMTTSASGQSANRNARLNVLMTAFAEAVKGLPYETCAAAPTYQGLFESTEEALADEADDLRNSLGATLTVLDVEAGPECPGTDTGVQTITLLVESRGTELQRQIVKRTPHSGVIPLDFDFEIVRRSGDNDPLVVWGLRATGSSHIFQFEWWCDGSWAVADPQPDPLPEPIISYTPDDPEPECRYAAPPEGQIVMQRIALRVTEAGTNRVAVMSKEFQLQTTLAPHNPPVAQITVTSSPSCLELTPCTYNTDISFASTGPDPVDASILQWIWNFGDGSPQVLCTSPSCQDQVHAFPGGGVFEVTLVVVDSFGASSTPARRNVFIDGPQQIRPTIAPPGSALLATPTYGVSAQTVHFDASGSHAHGESPGVGNPPGGIAEYHWDFGNGVTQSGENLATVSYTYPATTIRAVYTVTVTVTDTQNVSNHATIEIVLDPLVPPINLRNSGAHKGDLPFIRNAYFDFQWINVPRTAGDTISYEIMISSSAGFCGGLGVGLSGRTFGPIAAGPAGTTQNYRASFSSSPRGFNGVCATDSYNFRARTIRNGIPSAWSNPQPLEADFF